MKYKSEDGTMTFITGDDSLSYFIVNDDGVKVGVVPRHKENDDDIKVTMELNSDALWEDTKSFILDNLGDYVEFR